MMILKVFMLLIACMALFLSITSSVIKLVKACKIPEYKVSLIPDILLGSIGLCYIILYCTNTL